jgi:serine phosphatase RsbU (regulator of sigma subunit)
VLAVLATLAGLLLFAGALLAAIPLLRAIKRRLLWRVRRKLTISYIFIGVVPAILIAGFFLLCGLLLFFNVGGYLVRSRAASLVDEARALAQLIAADPIAEVPAGTSKAIVPGDQIPAWVPRNEGQAALVAIGASEPPTLAARAVAWIDAAAARAAVVEIPFESDVELRAATDGGAAPQWVTFLEYTDWATGERKPATVPFRMDAGDVYRRIAGGLRTATDVSRRTGTDVSTPAPIGTFDFGRFLLVLVTVVGALFLVIEIAALGMGLGLARTITGSIHDLFEGTERIRRGDFSHRIPIRRRDQLGELAASFNSMTASVEDLLQQKAEKERLAQELKVARDIQMSLLPQGPVRMPGLALTGYCDPAREVGGDYYDFLRIDEQRLGVLIADVAGKGTSAALYMAELKGLMLALSQRYRSPRALLIEANRILSRQLDPSSFITMTYAVVDLEARTLTHARAGHCPLLYLPAAVNGRAAARLLIPEGMVLGLQIDNGEMFNRLLEEVTIPIAAGDLFVLYTDGVTEATNDAGEWFGDLRLAGLIEEHGTLPFDQLRERLLREVEIFAGAQPQHDDMTWVLVRVE